MMRKNVSSSAMSEREMCSSTSNDDVEKEAVSTRRNALLLSACATAFGFFTNAEEAEAAAPAEFAEETLKMINMTKDISTGKITTKRRNSTIGEIAGVRGISHVLVR